MRITTLLELGCKLLIQRWWAELDSNQRRRKPAILQTAPFSHSGIYPFSNVWLLTHTESQALCAFNSPIVIAKNWLRGWESNPHRSLAYETSSAPLLTAPRLKIEPTREAT